RLAYRVSAIPGASKLPRALVILLENVIRNAETDEQAVAAATGILEAGAAGKAGSEIEFMPARVLFQDLTGVPVFVDFATMRDEMARRGGDPSLVNPHIPCTLIIDHSVVADCAGVEGACDENEAINVVRNRERFAFLKWAGEAFDNVEIVPPGVGICHQLNTEVFSRVVTEDALSHERYPVACYDTVVGTDSHTTTVNGIGVLGWGVGGIEAEAAGLGQPITMLVPAIVELHLTGRLPSGSSGMDLALRVTQLLPEAGVVGDIVEVTGPGCATLTATQRACVANMTPEYGSTSTLFPVDGKAVSYLELTGRDAVDIAFVRAYNELQGTCGESEDRIYSRTIELDLSTVRPCLSGPSRPHNRVDIADLPERVRTSSAGHGHDADSDSFNVRIGSTDFELGHGTIALAAITSCTTATDSAMMVAAGLVAKKAVELGIEPKPWVKKVLAPGSHATDILLRRAGLSPYLERIGFFNCGFGCMSCIGNSGSIHPALHSLANDMELTSVLSGNRNFDGRISPDVAQNYLANPALVVVYSLVGTLDADLTSTPVAIAADGREVFLSELMPTDEEIASVLDEHLTPDVYAEGAEGLFEGGEAWKAIEAPRGATFSWDPDSTYIRCPPYFEVARPADSIEVSDARVLAFLGDFITTDHIAPAASIPAGSPAAEYLLERGVEQKDWSSYGARRGNHEIVMRGTFGNVRLENALAEGRIGGWTRDMLDGTIASIYDAAMDYQREGIDQIVLAGRMYGSGSSRDLAAKGPALLGVRAVIAETYERIHRSNLIGMGILPLQFMEGQSAASLGLDGSERYTIGAVDVSRGLPASRTTEVVARGADGREVRFACIVRVDTPTEGRYLKAGGILPFVIDGLGKQ
ncbi:MAG: aconitate hydratase AcnA, partial [Atopobiaceae bacterium]|nr:aconitate hydratase AcnA [Atopobiaceae bacterium]